MQPDAYKGDKMRKEPLKEIPIGTKIIVTALGKYSPWRRKYYTVKGILLTVVEEPLHKWPGKSGMWVGCVSGVLYEGKPTKKAYVGPMRIKVIL